MTDFTMGGYAAGQPRDDLTRLVKEAQARFESLTPQEQAEHRRAQRRSWVIGEMMLEHPEMTREQAIKLYESVV